MHLFNDGPSSKITSLQSPSRPRRVKNRQLVPLTPSLLLLGYLVGTATLSSHHDSWWSSHLVFVIVMCFHRFLSFPCHLEVSTPLSILPFQLQQTKVVLMGCLQLLLSPDLHHHPYCNSRGQHHQLVLQKEVGLNNWSHLVLSWPPLPSATSLGNQQTSFSWS